MSSRLKISHLTPKSQKEVSLSIKDKDNLRGLVDVFVEQKDKPVISVYLCCSAAVSLCQETLLIFWLDAHAACFLRGLSS